ncbi:hypothetical protein H5410_034007 [Solanum commersonii]|uniref:Fe2OG dioxygenase domain-containing protein n=1 Tax=Solanum commersonii TaxID=4109 RepID=A0A9J5YRY6_SOLCO|nr:hypothetical protein H5410_034007 [Solanum commersonii]
MKTTSVLSCGFNHSTLPESYVRPESQRPRMSEVVDRDDLVPVIDMSCTDRNVIVHQIGEACRLYGFFQVINHSVSKKVMDEMLGVAHEFFKLPVEEKMKLYSDDPSKTMRLSTSFNVKRKLFIIGDIILGYTVILWTNMPLNGLLILLLSVSKYCMEVRQLGYRLEEVISESLGLEKDCIKNVLGEQGQHMAINFYPPCPQPELTYGLPAHTDPNAITILLQDLQVAGLQVLQDGEWLSIKPQPDAFVINLGDQLEAMSNGKYKSIWHRAIVNSDKARMSVASFLCPNDCSIISAPKTLIEDGSSAIYRDFTYTEYYDKFWSRNLDQEYCLELFKNDGT